MIKQEQPDLLRQKRKRRHPKQPIEIHPELRRRIASMPVQLSLELGDLPVPAPRMTAAELLSIVA
jgi:hypothetical protein